MDGESSSETFGGRHGLLVKRNCESRRCDNTAVTDVQIGYRKAELASDEDAELLFVAHSYCVECQTQNPNKKDVVSQLGRRDKYIPL